MDPNEPLKKRGNPNMRPGAPSLNPSGRPRGAKGLAAYVAEQTSDGRELVDRLLELSRDPKAPIRERFAATTALLDRAVGKPLQPSEIQMSIERAIEYPPGWEQLEPGQRSAWLVAHRARLMLESGS